MKEELDQNKKEIESLKELQKVNEKLYGTLKKFVTCSICNKIFFQPIELPCLNSICQKHLIDFINKNCDFCNQTHQLSIGDEFKTNENISQTIEADLHLSENEKQLKKEIEQLFTEIKSVSSDFMERNAQLETYCYDHFISMINGIDLQREELKKRIDEINEHLVNKVKECKSKYENELKENALKKSLDQDEIHKLDLSFYDGLRQPQIFEFYNLKWNLLDNIAIFKSKILKIHILKQNIAKCCFDVKQIQLDSAVYGDLTIDFKVVV